MQVLDVARRAGVPLPPNSVIRAYVRSAVTRCPLPPGDFESLFNREVKDRKFLMKRFNELGPVFRAYDWGHTWICILGLARCRRFLREASGRVRMDTMDVRPAIPAGIIRAMEGDDHSKYRRALVAALRTSAPLSAAKDAEAIIFQGLDQIEATDPTRPQPLAGLSAALSHISSRLLFHAVLGVQANDPSFDEIAAGYDQLGPTDLVWTVGPEQLSAYRGIVASCRYLAGTADGSILGAARKAGTLDETLLGNLIYMVEMGRRDLAGLMKWAICNLAAHPEYADRLAAERSSSEDGDRPIATAFVRETMRLDQSERLTRYATEEFRFDGYLVPKNSRIRLCIWESHKDASSFDDPFAFQAQHFLGSQPDLDHYAPFGLDHHICPFDTFTVRACALILGAVASRWKLEKHSDGPAIRGRYHWHPSPEIELHTTPR